MKRSIVKIIIIIAVIINFSAYKVIFAHNINDEILLGGNNILPSLFFEHNLYNHMTEEGEIIYCIEPEKTGTESSSYKGRIVKDINIYSQNQLSVIKSAVINGYPDKRILNRHKIFTDKEAQCLTAMAIRAICMEFKGMTRGLEAEQYIDVQHGDKEAKIACRELVVYAKQNPFIGDFNSLTVKCLSKKNEIISGNMTMVGKEYVIEGKKIKGKLSISGGEPFAPDLVFPETVENGQSFHIAIPIKNTFEKINRKLSIKAIADKDLIFIKAKGANRQSYIGIVDVDKEINKNIDFNIEPNIMSLRLIKKDKETEEVLPGAHIRIWMKQPSGNDIQIGTYVTDKTGMIYIEGLSQLGEYYYEEISAPPGYDLEQSDNCGTINIRNYGEIFERIVYNKKTTHICCFVQISGYRQVAGSQPLEYKITDGVNASNEILKNYSLSIDVPEDYYNLDKKIEIGRFEDKGACQLFLRTADGSIEEIKKNYIDKEDHLINIVNTTRNIKGIFTGTDTDSIKTAETTIRELIVKFDKETEVEEFTTPVFKNIRYSLYIRDKDKEILEADNLEGNKSYSFKKNNLRGYRLVFESPVKIKSFTNKGFTIMNKCNYIYDVEVTTNKGNRIILLEGLSSNIKNLIDIEKMKKCGKLGEDEIISEVKILFRDDVRPGMIQCEPIVLTGSSNELNSKVDRNILGFNGRVNIEGEYGEKKAENSDEYSTGSYGIKISLASGSLPSTGGQLPLFSGICTFISGLLSIAIKRPYDEK